MKLIHPVRNTLADPDWHRVSAGERRDRGLLGERPWSLGQKTVVSLRCSADNAVAAFHARWGFKPLFAGFTLDYCLNGGFTQLTRGNGTRTPCVRHDTAKPIPCPWDSGVHYAGQRPFKEFLGTGDRDGKSTFPLKQRPPVPIPAFQLRFSGLGLFACGKAGA